MRICVFKCKFSYIVYICKFIIFSLIFELLHFCDFNFEIKIKKHEY